MNVVPAVALTSNHDKICPNIFLQPSDLTIETQCGAGLEYANTLGDIDAIQADFSQLPLYNGDLETKEGDVIRFPADVEEFRALVASADAFLFAVPEYNYSLPGMALMLLSLGRVSGMLGPSTIETHSGLC